ncbi:hypothetical protein HNR16_001003 [Pseudoclavibacter chungangensis]|nr:hypothetical protein [Pseudoclavibacter chungangensis]
MPITPSGAPSPGSDPRGSDPRGYDPHGYDPTGYPSGPAAERGALDVSRPQQVPVYGLRTVGEHGGQPPFPPHGGAGAPAARRARPALWIWTSVAVVVLLVAGVVAAEFITRAQTAGRIDDLAASIALTTDAGDAVEGPFSAEIVDGGSSLLQAMGGTIDHVHIEAPDQRVDGESLSTTFDLHEVPVGLDGPAGRVDVTLGADPEALLQLLEYEIDTSLTDGLELTSTELSGDALHFEYTSAYGIVVTHDLEIHAEDGKIVLSPTNYTMTLFGYDLDLGDGDPVELGLCADSGLDGTMEDITTESGRFVLTWSVTGAAPTPQGLAEAWSCI